MREAHGWEEPALRVAVMERSSPDGKHKQVFMKMYGWGVAQIGIMKTTGMECGARK